MNQRDYDNGYFRGYTTTPDEREGARAAAADRQRKEHEAATERFLRKTEAENRERERNERQLQEQMREQERRRKESAQIQQQEKIKKQAAKTSSQKKSAAEDSDWSTGAAVLGFIISAAWTASQTHDTGPIIMAGLLGAVVIGRFYKAIIGITVVVFILAALAGYK